MSDNRIRIITKGPKDMDTQINIDEEIDEVDPFDNKIKVHVHLGTNQTLFKPFYSELFFVYVELIIFFNIHVYTFIFFLLLIYSFLRWIYILDINIKVSASKSI